MKNKLIKGKLHLKPSLLLVSLVMLVILTRLILINNYIIPFSFDHGKDSIAVLHMVKTNSLKFIGPWTSIPGLYFGPGWYYLLAPSFIISQGNPVAPIIILISLLVIQVLLAWKYLGKLEAHLIATAPAWFTVSTSAWNPFPMTLITLIIVILLKRIASMGKLFPQEAFFLALTASFGFHFSSALAIFYPIIIILILLLRRVEVSLSGLISSLIGYSLPFIPQLLFEIKHGFIQSKAVINYFAKGEPHRFNLDKVIHVTTAYINELLLAVIPEARFEMIDPLIKVLGISLIALSILLVIKRNRKVLFLKESLIFLFIPLLGYFFLHFNVWYVYGLLPVAVILVAQFIRHLPPALLRFYILLLILTPFWIIGHFFLVSKSELEESRAFLPVKLEALNYIYQQAGDKPFASYHYVPDIYDYSYQYLYFLQGYNGKPLPIEFSYKPDAATYIPEKAELMEDLGGISSEKPELVFFVVEKPEREEFLRQWWIEQKYEKILEEKKIGKEVTVYTALPEKR